MRERWNQILRGIIAVITGLALGACSTVPVTGRSSLNLIPDAELASMSLTSYQEFLATAPLSKDAKSIATVRRVGERMAAATEEYLRGIGRPASFQWEFNVVDEPETANAWVMPGGKVVVYTGILPIAQDDTGLAVVMGHEIAHIVAQHGNERMSQALLTQLGGAALSVALSNSPEMTRSLFAASYGAGTQVGILMPFSRLHESEADRIGLTLMAIAGYDPRAAVDFWGRMAKQGGPRPPKYLSTHPAPENRIANIQAHLPEALAVYRPR
jgi:predicted Zn-dependent protease